MIKKKERLIELKNELDKTYLEMNEILKRNGLQRRQLNNLPNDDYQKWNELNSLSTTLISEFSDLIRNG